MESMHLMNAAITVNAAGLAVMAALAALCFVLAVRISRGGPLPGGRGAEESRLRRRISACLAGLGAVLLLVPGVVQLFSWRIAALFLGVTAAILVMLAGGLAAEAAPPDGALTPRRDLPDNARR